MIGIYNTIAFDGQNTGKTTVLNAGKNVRVHFTNSGHTKVPSLKIGIKASQSSTPAPDSRVSISGVSGVYYYVAANSGATGTSYYKSLSSTRYGGEVDTITGRLKITHNIMRLTSSMSWSLVGSSTSRAYRAPINNLATDNIDTSLCLCTHAVYGTAIWFGNFRYSDGYVYFNDGQGHFTSLSAFTTWLDEQNTTSTYVQIVYPLKAPEYYTLTPLEFTMRAGENYVYTTANDLALSVVEPYIVLKRPTDLEITREDIYAGEYTTCTGAVKADRIGWKYADTTLEFDELTTDELNVISGMYGAVTFYFDDSDGAHDEQVIKTGFTNTPTRLTLPDGSIIWKNCGVTLRFINAHN